MNRVGRLRLGGLDDVSALFSMYAVHLDPLHGSMKGAMVWAAWIEGPEFDVAMASDNPCALISSAERYADPNAPSIQGVPGHCTFDYHRVISFWPN